MTKKQEIKQVILYILIAASAGIIQAGSFALFEEVLNMPYWPSYLISLVLSILWNFTINRKYTFKSTSNLPRAMLLVALFYVIFTPLSTIIGDKLTAAGWNDYIVLALTMIVNLVTEFLYQKHIVFK
ncbi:MAG: GtrA family protein [Oscillospiraceae bacterium]|nr:GtrA family protein [Oscillospiraceae bacterium]MBR0451082.1 GtrA family protein [Oscillospiraceae bacterium]